MTPVDEVMWAIKHLPTGGMVGDKWGRTLWVRKPTNALNSIAWRYNRNTGKDIVLVSVRVHVKEIQEDA
jgi:hypothetical protein